MRRARGIRFEILISLAVVTVTAAGLLGAFLLKAHEIEFDRMRGALGRALLAEAREPAFEFTASTPGLHWWVVSGGSVVFEKGGDTRPIDAEALAMAAEVEAGGEALIRPGLPWQPIRFAARAPSTGGVAVASLQRAVAPLTIALVLLCFVGIFGSMSAYLLRQRVVVPLARLAWAAEAVAHSGPGVRVEVDDIEETAAVARAFNEMNEALEGRTGALEKAVADLRSSNESLRTARAGLDRAERLAAVGRLAAGVAHEVGNPMGALLAFLELARRDDSLSAAGRAHLERASGQGERVREILRQLLDFSRPPRASREPVDLAVLAEQTRGLVAAQRRYAQIVIEVDAAAEIEPVLTDAGMVSQVLLNLLLNAADALEGVEDPRIVITLRLAPMHAREGDEAEALLRRSALDAVECEVADSGYGVSDEDRERIFDPFFTTKAPGEGTGLGLANSQRLAEELGGVLEYRPAAVLGGAAFVLRLPTRLATEGSEARGERRIREGDYRRSAGGCESS